MSCKSYESTWDQAESKRVNRKSAVKNCDEACTELNCDTNEGDNSLQKSILQTMSLTSMYKKELKINEPNMCLPLEPSVE
jgi:hypothetical protein